MSKIHRQHIDTAIGRLVLASFDGKLCMLDYQDRKNRTQIDKRIQTQLNTLFVEQNDDVLDKTRLQLNEYLAGSRQQFDVPLLMLGTDFQKQVWTALLALPYGKTASYQQQALSINNAKATRAVANANGANAIAVIIPCHRIIGSNGSLTGYAGGLKAKQYLLQLESQNENFSCKHVIATSKS